MLEFTEVESGKKVDRPKLQEAIKACQQHGAKLLITKLDRLCHNTAFVMTLRDSGVDFVACDLQDDNTFTVGMMVTFAKYEAGRTSERTKATIDKDSNRSAFIAGINRSEKISRMTEVFEIDIDYPK